MPTVRPIPESYYYSGQGRLLIGDRDPATGETYNFVHVGNCTALSIEISVDKSEHTESQSGQRSTDKTNIKKKNATIKFTAESLSPENLAIGLYGEALTVAGATVTDEPHRFTTGDDGTKIIALKYPSVSAVSVKTGAVVGSATAVEASKYRLDPEFGTIHVLDSSAFTGVKVFVSYTYGAVKRLDIFTKSLPDEKALRFEGLNTSNDDCVLLTVPRVAFDPVSSLPLINEEFGSVEFNGAVLQDGFIASGSQFMTQTVITPAA